MTNNPDKDSFASVAKRSSKNVRPASGILPPNTRLCAKSTNQQKSSVPTQINATRNNVDDSSRISNRSASSSHYKELLRQQEEHFAAEKQKFIDQFKDMQGRENDLKSTINGLEFNLETSNITNNRLHKEIDHLGTKVYELSAKKADHETLNQDNQAKVVTENKKNKNKNNNDFSYDNDDEDSDLERGDPEDENKSYTSASGKNYSTPATSNNPPGAVDPNKSHAPIMTPPPQGAPPPGHIYTQYRHTDGSVL